MVVYFIAYILGGIPSKLILNSKIREYLSFKIPYITDNKNYVASISEIIFDIFKALIIIWFLPKVFMLLLNTPLQFCLYPFINYNVLILGSFMAAYLGHILVVYSCGWGKKGSALLVVGSIILVPQISIYLIIASFVFALITRSVRITSWLLCLSIPLCIWYYDSKMYMFIGGALLLSLINTIAFLHDLNFLKKYAFKNKK